jgi:hypothetical protein
MPGFVVREALVYVSAIPFGRIQEPIGAADRALRVADPPLPDVAHGANYRP